MLNIIKNKVSILLLCTVLFSRVILSCSGGKSEDAPASEPSPDEPPQQQAENARPLVFASSQLKYNLYENYVYTGHWIDRPLLLDRATEPSTSKVDSIDSFGKTIDIIKSYNIDGISSLVAHEGMLNRYLSAIEFTNQIAPENFQYMHEFGGDPNDIDSVLAYQGTVITEALRSNNTAKIDDKILIVSYIADDITPEAWKNILTELRNRYGNTFLFIADVEHGWSELWSELQAKGSISNQKIEDIKAHIRSYLDIADGIMFRIPITIGDSKNYDRKVDFVFYDKNVIPIIEALFKEDSYKNKLLGVNVGPGYVNPWSGVMVSEDGTKTLRYAFETAVGLKANVINLREWNEVNENTCFQPTVYNSFTTQRLLKYYMHKLKKEALTPNPGDDLTIPNLALSYRSQAKLGEVIEFELLNIPDATSDEEYTATLNVQDMLGNNIREFQTQKFKRKELRDATFSIATEEIPQNQVIIPVLTLTNWTGETMQFNNGFQPIKIRPTWTWNYKWVKQPLRDMIRPSNVRFDSGGEDTKILPAAGGRLIGRIETNEPLASLEVLEDEYEIYTVDVNNEYPDRNAYTIFLITYESHNSEPFTGDVTIRGSDFELYPRSPRGFSSFHKRDGNKVIIDSKAGTTTPPRGFYLAMANTSADEAILNFNTNLVRANINFADVMNNGVVSIARENGFILTVKELERIPDIPVHINQNQEEFNIAVTPKSPNSVFYMRAITKSGKTYRSLPVVVEERRSGFEVPFPLFSETRQGVTTINLPREWIPDIEYSFIPNYLAVLPTPAGRNWYGQLGGGSLYGQPFSDMDYPTGVTDTAPLWWVTEDGENVLRFDGLGSFIFLPTEAFPRGSFTLSFDIQPLARGNYTLFTHFGKYHKSLTIGVNETKLYGWFVDNKLQRHNFDTDITIATRDWTRIDIIYDMNTLIIRTNGVEGYRTPFNARALYMGPAAFGGYPGTEETYPNLPSFFKGYLRSLRIVHRAVE